MRIQNPGDGRCVYRLVILLVTFCVSAIFAATPWMMILFATPFSHFFILYILLYEVQQRTIGMSFVGGAIFFNIDTSTGLVWIFKYQIKLFALSFKIYKSSQTKSIIVEVFILLFFLLIEEPIFFT